MAEALTAPKSGGDPTLSRGAAGRALALAYLGRDLDRPDLLSAAEAALDGASAALAERRMTVGLMQGFTGVAWAAAHLANEGFLEAFETAAVDRALESALTRASWTGNFDLVSGLVGIGVYGLERGAAAAELTALVVRALARLAERPDDGVTWFTPPEALPPEARARVPSGYYNLGVAHGVPGAVAFLSRALLSGVDEAAPLLEGAVSWLLARRLPPGSPSAWPYFTGSGIEPAPARLAWCYGAPGIATALHAAAVATGAEWLRAETDLAWDEVVARAGRESGVQGMSLCHGAAGLAHLLRRGHLLTGRADLAAASTSWIERTLEGRRDPDGLAGYSVWDPELDEESGDLQGPGLLAGLAGVALTLAGAATGSEPSWDRFLLVSGGAA